MYVHYGCGHTAPPSWINFDASPTLRFEKIPFLGKIIQKNEKRFPKNIKYGDIVKGLPIPQESCDAIYCAHVLEHLSYQDCLRAVKNTFSHLKVNGIFRLVVPDLKCLASWYLKNTNKSAANDFIMSTGLGLKERKKGIFGAIVSAFGNSRHQWMYDEQSLSTILLDAGFRNVRNVGFGETENKAFMDVEEINRFEGSFGLEAKKP
jgi:predicted SAM-dependent methyltransferase